MISRRNATVNRNRTVPLGGGRRRRSARRPSQTPRTWIDRPFTLRDVASTSRAAYAVGRQALAMINAEKKHFDVTGTSTPGSTQTLVLLNGIAQGDSDTSRDGIQVRMKGLQLIFQMNLDASNMTFDFFRVLVVRHYQPQGTTPVASLFLASTSINSLKNWHAKNLFEVLYDRTWSLDTYHPVASDSIEFKLDDVSRWNGSGSASTDLDNNGYWLLLYGTENTNKTVFGYSTRMLFYDN